MFTVKLPETSSFIRKLSLASVSSAILLTTGLATHADALDFSFRGTFNQDDDVQLFNFTVGSTSTVTLKTLSYAGGVQADGTVIPDGGFDPILAVFDGNGDFIANNDDGGDPDVPPDPTTGAFFDTFLEVTLDPGNYTVAVSQYDNFFDGDFGDNISQGFVREGEPNFTAGLGGCTADMFCDFTGDARTNEWAFDILNVDDAVVIAVPEPLTLLGAGTALGFGTFFKRQVKRLKKGKSASS